MIWFFVGYFLLCYKFGFLIIVNMFIEVYFWVCFGNSSKEMFVFEFLFGCCMVEDFIWWVVGDDNVDIIWYVEFVVFFLFVLKFLVVCFE